MSSQRRLQIPQFDLSDIYDADQLHDAVQVARGRVLHAFNHATETHFGVTRGTDYYLGGAGPKQRELVEFVLGRRMKSFVSLSTLPTLPPQLVGLTKRPAYTELVKQVHERTLRLAVESLAREQIIWHDSCVWNVLPSALMAYRAEQRAIAKVTKVAKVARRASRRATHQAA